MYTLTTFKPYFDSVFIPYLELKLAEACIIAHHAVPFISQTKTILSLARGGKRIRAYTAYLGVISSGKSFADQMLPLLYAIELFHLFALVHDDIIDGDVFRRGVPTVHILHGQNDALLWGDLLYALAFDAIAQAPLATETRILFGRMAQETIIGQMLDVHQPREHTSFVEQQYGVLLKTSQYTFVYPFLLGQSMSGAVTPPLFSMFTSELGITFQLQDDITDGDSVATGSCGSRELGCRVRKLYTYIVRLPLQKEHQRMWCLYLQDLFREKCVRSKSSSHCMDSD